MQTLGTHLPVLAHVTVPTGHPQVQVPGLNTCPSGHVFETHLPPQQTVPGPHDAQVPPALPQAAAVFPGWQVLAASQQPLGQLAAVHLQTPLTQPWPAAQAVPQAPQFWVVFSGVQTPLQQP